MAKPSKKKPGKRDRRERRFFPRAGTNANIVRGLFMIGAAALGAGLWGLIGKQQLTGATEAIPYSTWITAAGLALLGICAWLATSADPPFRVGDPGVAYEKGELKRIPWWGLEKISTEDGGESVVVRGKQESGARLTFKLRLKSHADGVAWLVREARERLGEDVLDLPEDFDERLPKASAAAGVIVKLDPMQLVGKRCAESGDLIAYEPDARVCTRCERVYHKTHVPKRCACGANMSGKKSDEPKPEAEEPKAEPSEESTAEA